MIKKWILNTVLLSLMTLVSCQNEEQVQTEQANSVTLKVGTFAGSRTQADKFGKVTWSKGDKMLVYGDNAQGVLTLVGEGGESVGTFTGFVFGNPDNLKWSIYPAEGSSVTDKGAEITLSKVAYPYSNSPMVGEIGKDKHVDLNHLCSMVRIPVKNIPANAKMKIRCSGIAGKAEWDGKNLSVTSPSELIEVEVPVGGDLNIDIPVFAGSTTVEKTFTITIDETSTDFKASVGVGKLNTNSNVAFECKVENGKVTGVEKKNETGITINKENDPMTEDDEEYLIGLN